MPSLLSSLNLNSGQMSKKLNNILQFQNQLTSVGKWLIKFSVRFYEPRFDDYIMQFTHTHDIMEPLLGINGEHTSSIETVFFLI